MAALPVFFYPKGMKHSRPVTTRVLLVAIVLVTLISTAPPAAAQPPLVLTPGPVFAIDTPRPVGRVVGRPLAIKCPGISRNLIVWTRGGDDGVAHTIWAREVEEGSNPPLFTPERVLVRVPAKSIVDVRLSAGWNRYALSWRTFDPLTRKSELFVRVLDRKSTRLNSSH